MQRRPISIEKKWGENSFSEMITMINVLNLGNNDLIYDR